MDTKQIIKKFILRFIGNYDLKDDENIFENKLVNSLFAMQLVAFIEKEFDIVLDNTDFAMDNFKDINSIASLIELKS